MHWLGQINARQLYIQKNTTPERKFSSTHKDLNLNNVQSNHFFFNLVSHMLKMLYNSHKNDSWTRSIASWDYNHWLRSNFGTKRNLNYFYLEICKNFTGIPQDSSRKANTIYTLFSFKGRGNRLRNMGEFLWFLVPTSIVPVCCYIKNNIIETNVKWNVSKIYKAQGKNGVI